MSLRACQALTSLFLEAQAGLSVMFCWSRPPETMWSWLGGHPAMFGKGRKAEWDKTSLPAHVNRDRLSQPSVPVLVFRWASSWQRQG